MTHIAGTRARSAPVAGGGGWRLCRGRQSGAGLTCARDDHRFESPQLHHKVSRNWRGFLRRGI